MWIYLDNTNRVLGYNPNNMEGNTGWVEATKAPPENHMDYLYIDGEYIYDPLPAPEPVEPTPTMEERVLALETENAQLKEALELLLSGATEEEVATDV